MQSIDSVSSLRELLASNRERDRMIGFVPTMGAFHEGHLTLMRRAKEECGICIVSLFVNPTQFGPGEDFDRYPRDLQRDADLAESAGADVLFAPPVEEIYPPGPEVSVRVKGLGDRWEGERRPGHFDGVTTVCSRLFNIVQPQRAYFGMKDYQQLKIIQRMVQALHIPTEIVAIPTVREPDGLAMSSRNAYLSESERLSAVLLYKGLNYARLEHESGERSAPRLEAAVRRSLRQEPRVMEDYIAVADSETLKPLNTVATSSILLAAVRIGRTRLIDNILLTHD